MEHNKSGEGRKGPSLEEILTYLVKFRNESREHNMWVRAKLEKLEDDFVQYKEQTARENSWADVYEYKEEGQDIPVASSSSQACYFRRREEGTVEGDDFGYDDTSQEEITVDEEHSVLKVDGGSRGEEQVVIDGMGRSGNEGGGNMEQDDDDDNDDEVQILDEVCVTGKGYSPSEVEVVQPGPSSRGSVGSSGNQNETTRRTSFFTPVKKGGTEVEASRVPKRDLMPDLSSSLNLSTIFNEGNTPESSTADGDVGDVNDIFDGILDRSDPPPPILSPPIPKRKNKSENQRERKIKRIAKAPIKEEPIPLQSFRTPCMTDDLLSLIGSPHHLNLPSPPLSNREENVGEGVTTELQAPLQSAIVPPLLLKNIKVERQAHALKDKKPDEEGRYFCICGHYVFTKSGLQGHVAKKGCEEPRFLCPEDGCERKCVYSYEVQKHLLSVHGKEYPVFYGCKKCSSYFYVKREYKAHKAIGNCNKPSSRRKGQAVELNRAPLATIYPGSSSSMPSTSSSRGFPPQPTTSELGRPSQVIVI